MLTLLQVWVPKKLCPRTIITKILTLPEIASNGGKKGDGNDSDESREGIAREVASDTSRSEVLARTGKHSKGSPYREPTVEFYRSNQLLLDWI